MRYWFNKAWFKEVDMDFQLSGDVPWKSGMHHNGKEEKQMFCYCIRLKVEMEGERTAFRKRIHAQHLQISKLRNKTYHSPSPQRRDKFPKHIWNSVIRTCFQNCENNLLLWNSSKACPYQGPLLRGHQSLVIAKDHYWEAMTFSSSAFL